MEIPSLVFAGGYDTQVTENVEVYRELQQEAAGHWERDRLHIVFLKSIEDRLRWCLLRHAIALIYTPSQEHFGIVPLEAMAMGCPVIACASGGVPETVINEKTGYLCPDDIENNIPGEFGKALSRILAMSESERDNQRHECEKHVEDMFNTRDLADRLAKVIHLVA